MSYILIIGGNSDIGKALAKEYSKLGYNLYLTCRDLTQLDNYCSDLSIRYSVKVYPKKLDVLEFNSHNKFYNSLNPKPVGAISCVGYLDDQNKAENDFDICLKSINTNYVALVSLLNLISNDFIKDQKNNFIVGISSVAGERGRSSNYIYGSAKSGFTTYLSGLRSRLNIYNINVLTVIPGYVYTKMTSHIDLPAILTCTPKFLAKKIVKAQIKNKNTIYIKWFWRYLMTIIKLLPESFFKKLTF